LADFSEALLRRLQEYRGRDTELEDDVTLLTLRRKIGVTA
jgi:serine phosphatase RsbU (regulator of sigma subunit)